MTSVKPGVITTQPTNQLPSAEGSPWMQLPPSYEAATGLEYLSIIDEIIVQQRKEMMEILTGWECKNRYVLRNKNGEQVYYAFEESSMCARICCGHVRPYTIHVVDNFNREVMRFIREFKFCAGGYCCASACDACAMETFIESPPGNLIAIGKQRQSCCVANLTVLDASQTPIFEVEGESCLVMHCTCENKVFKINTMDGQQVGAISKEWGGCCKEAFTDADTFKVNFPIDLVAPMKAALIGVTFLIDFMEFEHKQN